jgi:hypothetical protein
MFGGNDGVLREVEREKDTTIAESENTSKERTE